MMDRHIEVVIEIAQEELSRRNSSATEKKRTLVRPPLAPPNSTPIYQQLKQ